MFDLCYIFNARDLQLRFPVLYYLITDDAMETFIAIAVTHLLTQCIKRIDVSISLYFLTPNPHDKFE
jgi:hypothetical protein